MTELSGLPVDSATARLRIGDTDPQRDRLDQHARAALRLIDRYLNLQPAAGRMSYTDGPAAVVTYPPGEVPADVVEAAVQLTGELLRRKDAPFGVLAGAATLGEPVRVSADQLRGVSGLLDPHVEGWGLA